MAARDDKGYTIQPGSHYGLTNLEINAAGISGTTICIYATWSGGSKQNAYTQIWLDGASAGDANSTIRLYGSGSSRQSLFAWKNIGTNSEVGFCTAYIALRDDNFPCGYDGKWVPAWWYGCSSYEDSGTPAERFQCKIKLWTYGIRANLESLNNGVAKVKFEEDIGGWSQIYTNQQAYGSSKTLWARPIGYYLVGSDGSNIGGTSVSQSMPLQTTMSDGTRSTRTDSSKDVTCTVTTYTKTVTINNLKQGVSYTLYAYVLNDNDHTIDTFGETQEFSTSGWSKNNNPVDAGPYTRAGSGVSRGRYDCYTSVRFEGEAKPPVASGNIWATGETITCIPTWSPPSVLVSQTCVVTCGGQSQTITSPGTTVRFRGLQRGTRYTVNCAISIQYKVQVTKTGTYTDSEGNSHSYTYTDWDFRNTSSSLSMSVETYKISLTLDATSTKAVKFSSRITNGANKSQTIKYKLTGGGLTKEGTVNGSQIINNLYDGTTYQLSAWIDEMRDYGDNHLDTLETISPRTKLLTLSHTSTTEHQHTIDTYWQALADGSTYDSCNITGDAIRFVLSKCGNVSSRLSGVLSHKGPRNGSVSGSYKHLHSYNLDYFTVYYITCTVTDGFNEASLSIYEQTIFPFCRIYHNGQWWKAMPWIKTESRWIPAPGFIKISDNQWMESNGE